MKRRHNHRRSRTGAVLVLVAISIIPLLACVALAIDLGLMMAARTQVADAADLAAMAGARALNGVTTSNSNNNYSSVLPTAQTAAVANSILGTTISTGQVSVNIGRYTYNTSTQQFEGQFPGPSTDNWSLVQATVSVPVTNSLTFSKIFGFTVPNIQATATAVHRPRDVAIILDFSGSMRFQSLAGGPWDGSNNNANNPDTSVPNFGHYYGNTSYLTATSFTSPYDAANVTTTTSDSRPPIATDFYSDANGTAAWTAQPSSYGTTPAGDKPYMTNKNTGSTYAHTVAEILNIANPGNGTKDNNWEKYGYCSYSMSTTFNAYTVGPGYWGKTFWAWPPDPSTYSGPSAGSNDWRQRYFYYYGTTNACDDNSLLWDSAGNWKAPGVGNYSINYTAILDFIKNIGPNPFPTSLRSGRIVYYSSIPSSINTSTWPPSNLDERFWKDYIDYCLGVVQTSATTWQCVCNGSTSYIGYGPDITWGTIKITPKSSLTGGTKPYMHYADNPQRPLTKFWFGPQSMMEFLGNFNLGYQIYDGRYFWWPGTCHEAPMYACKLGIRAALTDIQTNHPNDYVSLIYFSVPQTSSTDWASRFNGARVGLGRNYTNMLDALWYPPSTVGNSTATVSMYDSANIEVPRAFGGTCYSYPLMLAYNQFSGNTSLQTYDSSKPTGTVGGLGRKGAQKMIIFETDGCPNTSATATIQNSGAYNSYYNIRYNSGSPASSQFPSGVNGYSDLSSSVTTQILSVCSQICATDTASIPGYSSGNRLVKIHCIGFGPVFSPSGSNAAAATSFLNSMQTIGNVTDGMPSYKIIYGSQSTVISNLQTAFQTIMADGIQIMLIQ